MGVRAIADFRGVYRVWGRLRKKLLTTWEAGLLEDGAFNTGPGQRVTDTVWRAAVRRERERERERERASLQTGGPKAWALLLWDLAKAFEYVDHTELIRRAKAEHFQHMY